MLRDSLTPYQAQAANITPPPTYAGSNALRYTIVAEKGPYLIQTPHSGIVLGLPENVGIDEGISKKKDIYENTDDSYVKPEHKTCTSSTISIFLPGSTPPFPITRCLKRKSRLGGLIADAQGLESIVRRTLWVGAKKPREKGVCELGVESFALQETCYLS